jgi:hypothetical protein
MAQPLKSNKCFSTTILFGKELCSPRAVPSEVCLLGLAKALLAVKFYTTYNPE